jgi:hypothetical protein
MCCARGSSGKVQYAKLSSVNLEGNDLEDLGVDGSIVLR